MPTSFECFLESVRDRLGEATFAKVRERYGVFLENYAPTPLRIPDSMRANAFVFGVPDTLKILPSASSVGGNDATGQPYSSPYQPAPVMKDQSGKIDPKNWEHPMFKKPTHLASVPIRKMMERAKAHINNPIEMTNADQMYPSKVGPLSGRDGFYVPTSTYVGGDTGSSASASSGNGEG